MASGAHAAVVEVDDEHTGEIDILRYVVVHDAGNIVNPVIAEGQLTGGIAQGIGGALYEEMIYGPDASRAPARTWTTWCPPPRRSPTSTWTRSSPRAP